MKYINNSVQHTIICAKYQEKTCEIFANSMGISGDPRRGGVWILGVGVVRESVNTSYIVGESEQSEIPISFFSSFVSFFLPVIRESRSSILSEKHWKYCYSGTKSIFCTHRTFEVFLGCSDSRWYTE